LARVRLKFVNSYFDRHGVERHYFRRRGMKNAIALHGLPGSEQFMSEYAQALAGLPDAEKTEIGAMRTLPGTIDALCVSYYRSDAWLNPAKLTEDTRKVRCRIIERFRERHGPKSVALLRPDHFVAMLAGIDKPSNKRRWLAAIRGLFQHAVGTMVKEDPTAGVAMPRMPKTKGHHSWTDAEIAQFRAYWPCGTEQRPRICL
jgi:hypothetical protein